MAADRSSSNRVRKFQGERAILGVFYRTDNALYSIAFGTHIKTAEPIEMPFGIMTGLVPSNSLLRVDDDPRRIGRNF